MTLAQARELVGRTVLYRWGRSNNTGVITSVNDTYVFVRYGSSQQGIATRPQDLELHEGQAPVPPCSDCKTTTRGRSACPSCGLVFCRRCAETPYSFCCDGQGKAVRP